MESSFKKNDIVVVYRESKPLYLLKIVEVDVGNKTYLMTISSTKYSSFENYLILNCLGFYIREIEKSDISYQQYLRYVGSPEKFGVFRVIEQGVFNFLKWELKSVDYPKNTQTIMSYFPGPVFCGDEKNSVFGCGDSVFISVADKDSLLTVAQFCKNDVVRISGEFEGKILQLLPWEKTMFIHITQPLSPKYTSLDIEGMPLVLKFDELSFKDKKVQILKADELKPAKFPGRVRR